MRLNNAVNILRLCHLSTQQSCKPSNKQIDISQFQVIRTGLFENMNTIMDHIGGIIELPSYASN